jgi:hypothetical protein
MEAQGERLRAKMRQVRGGGPDPRKGVRAEEMTSFPLLVHGCSGGSGYLGKLIVDAKRNRHTDRSPPITSCEIG